MKVEIAENMLYSWLRHCMGCQIVQTNFKVSKHWKQKNEQKMTELLNQFHKEKKFEKFHFTSGKDKTSGKTRYQHLSTILNTTECDSVGILFDDKNTMKVFAYESAFHESKTHYNDNIGDGDKKSKNITPQKVIKKLFRNYLMVRSFFPNIKVELAFAAPLIADKDLKEINTNVKTLEAFVAEHADEKKLEILIISGDKFKKKIFQPLSDKIKEIADESELFVRAVKLLRLMDKIK